MTDDELDKVFKKSKPKKATAGRLFQVAKANVCRIVVTRGEDYLRILHCSPEELQSDIIAEHSEKIIKQLREKLALDIKAMRKVTLTKSTEHEKFDGDIKKCYQRNDKKREMEQ